MENQEWPEGKTGKKRKKRGGGEEGERGHAYSESRAGEVRLAEEEPPPREIALLLPRGRGQAVTKEERQAPAPSSTEREAHYPNTEQSPVALWLVTVPGGWWEGLAACTEWGT